MYAAGTTPGHCSACHQLDGGPVYTTPTSQATKSPNLSGPPPRIAVFLVSGAGPSALMPYGSGPCVLAHGLGEFGGLGVGEGEVAPGGGVVVGGGVGHAVS